jgi:predicted PurR-regulated permease PerM
MPHTQHTRTLTPDWTRLAALALLTLAGVYLCYRLVVPFLPGVTWAVALAVVGYPLHRRIARSVSSPNWAAALSTTLVVLVIAVPTAWVAIQIANESAHAAQAVREQTADGRWRETVASVPYGADLLARLDADAVESRARDVMNTIAARTSAFVEDAAGGVLQALVAVFVLFYCFRDHHRLLARMRELVPLAPEGTDKVLTRASDAIHATIYGTVLASALQAVTGGLLFWALGLPAPVLWGAVMFVLGVLPFVGAFLVWIPAAIYLATVERYGAALALVAWGLIIAGPVCYSLYAWAAGGRMRMHPVPTLLAFIGGLAVFGISGMILGPCVLAVTAALIDVWRHRAADGVPVEAQSETKPAATLEEKSARHAPETHPNEGGMLAGQPT